MNMCMGERMGYNGSLEFGHNWGGSPYIAPSYSAIKSATWTGTNTGIYGFNDGSIRTHNIINEDRFELWTAAKDGPLNWDSYILPYEEIEPYTP